LPSTAFISASDGAFALAGALTGALCFLVGKKTAFPWQTEPQPR